MILVRLQGGLGNQMFQYAFGKYLSKKNNIDLKLDTTLLEDRSSPHSDVTHRSFDLDIFALTEYAMANEEEIIFFNGNPNASFEKRISRKLSLMFSNKRLVIQNKNLFAVKYLKILDNTCVVGRWQSELFFAPIKEQIKKEFSLKESPNPEIIKIGEEINACNSICIHIRRGDLLTSTIYSQTIGHLNEDYYSNAIDLIGKRITKPRLFVFSDDVEWCEKNLKFPYETIVVPSKLAGRKASGHLYLMTKCKHFIISNSTFAWWGAWLADYHEKTVIAPRNWFKDKNLENKALFPQNWIVI